MSGRGVLCSAQFKLGARGAQLPGSGVPAAQLCLSLRGCQSGLSSGELRAAGGAQDTL